MDKSIMLQAMLVVSFLGLFAGNAFPHFVAGITKKDYPSALGNGPVVNFIVGWLGLNISALLAWWHGRRSAPFRWPQRWLRPQGCLPSACSTLALAPLAARLPEAEGSISAEIGRFGLPRCRPACRLIGVRRRC
jgi:hypothetical protein